MAPGRSLRAGPTLVALVLAPVALAAPSVTRVPRVAGLPVSTAYRLLHQHGLRVSVPAADLRVVAEPPDHVIATSPAADECVGVGSVVSLTLGCPGCAVGSPGVPIHLRHYRVPAFVNRSLLTAYRWVRRRQLFYEFHLGRLTAGNAPSFFANFRITRQKPGPGEQLALGRGSRCCGGAGGSFTPTPLIIWATGRTDRR